MDCASDTESDSESLGPTDTWITRPNLSKGTTGVNDLPDVCEALLAIQNINQHDLKHTDSFENIKTSLDTLIHFLDSIPGWFKSHNIITQVITTFSKIGQPSFLRRLLEYRKCLRLAASRERGANTRFIDVTRVDVILAKLSMLAGKIAGGALPDEPSGSTPSEWIRLRMQDDIIRGAIQIPESWIYLYSVIGFTELSPAAMRVAISLLFIAHIMVPQITNSKAWPDESPPGIDTLHALYFTASQASQTMSLTTSHDYPPGRVHLAMILSLFAVVDTSIRQDNTSLELSHLRPEGFGYLLVLMKIVMNQHVSSFLPLEDLDVAHRILLQWGNFVPWSWSTWNDQRIANTEYLRSMTATWVLHLNTRLFSDLALDQKVFGVDLKSVLFMDIFSSSLMVSQCLHEILKAKIQGAIPCHTIRTILSKLCWAAIQYLESHAAYPNPALEGQILDFGEVLLLIFPLLLFSDEDDLCRNLIIEALSLVPLHLFTTIQRKILQNKEAHFLLGLNKATTDCIREYSDHHEIQSDKGKSNAMKVMLEFSSIMLLQPASEDAGVRDVVSSFFNLVAKLLRSREPGSHLVGDILDSFLTTLCALQGQPVVQFSNNDVWSLIRDTAACRLSTPAVYAQYLLLGMDDSLDPLLWHESWDYLLNALNMIVDRQFQEDEEPLALSAGIGICHALRKIHHCCHPLTLHRLHSSPWTISVCMSMRKLLDYEASDNPNTKVLQEIFRKSGKAWLGELSHETDDSEKGDTFTLDTPKLPRLMYYRDHYYSGLIPVCNIGSCIYPTMPSFWLMSRSFESSIYRKSANRGRSCRVVDVEAAISTRNLNVASTNRTNIIYAVENSYNKTW